MLLHKNKYLISISTFLLTAHLYGAPFYCGGSGATYAVQAQCDNACGTACQSITANTVGSSGTCDTATYDGFTFINDKTYAITKALGFWDNFSNLAKPTSTEVNTILKGIANYYGGNGWIGVYDPLKSASFNTVDPARFLYEDGTPITYSNWSGGQPDNKLDNMDIGVTAVSGEHWGYMQSDGTWSDDGYHKSYGGDYKPKRKGVVEWNGPLNCVNGVVNGVMSGKTGYWCGDGAGNLAQCTVGAVPTSSSVCTSPYVWNSSTQKCKYSYTATGTTTASSYTATATTTGGLTYDNCEGGLVNWTNATNYCAGKGMRLPAKTETISGGGCVPSCGSWTWTSTPYYTFAGWYWAWNGGDSNGIKGTGNTTYFGVRCVK